MSFVILDGDCLPTMQAMEENSIDSIVTDPPYGLTFMQANWDRGVPGAAFWRAALRVAKPGAHLLAFGGTRTFHRLTVAIEDAGWEIRDCVMWVHSQGFPKSLNVGKAIDQKLGAEREIVGHSLSGRRKQSSWNPEGKSTGVFRPNDDGFPVTAAASEKAKEWEGWGTALTPSWEPVILARKPFSSTVADNVMEWGTGAINVDGCRIGDEEIQNGNGSLGRNGIYGKMERNGNPTTVTGRWPKNFIHDGSEDVEELFPYSPPAKRSNRGKVKVFEQGEGQWIGDSTVRGHDDRGGTAARFFYAAKASKRDRDEGLGEGFPLSQYSHDGREKRIENPYQRNDSLARNPHPTVKPTPLMRYLCRLITPPGGVVLDPFAGSGSTGKAAILEGFSFVGIELDPMYANVARERISWALAQTERKGVENELLQ